MASKRYIPSSDRITLTAPYALSQWEGAMVGGIFAVATYDVAAGGSEVFITQGVVTLAKVSGQSWAQGDAIYFDTLTHLCTNVAGGNHLIGDATAATSGATGSVRLRGIAQAPVAEAIHPHYFFHGFAGNHVAGDDKFFDMAAGNHGIRGANLSDSEMFATAGYVTTKAPANPYDTCIRIPNLNFDYSIGEKLFVWWLGKVTPEANERAFIGDGFGTGTSGNGQRGVHIRVNQSGKLTMAVYGATAKAGALSNAVPFDGATHDIAVLFDGENRKYGYWIDGQMDSSFAGAMAVLDAVAYDTKNSNTFNLGSSSPAPGTATAPQSGIASATRAFVVIRLPASYSAPSVTQIANVCKALRANPGKLLVAGAL